MIWLAFADKKHVLVPCNPSLLFHNPRSRGLRSFANVPRVGNNKGASIRLSNPSHQANFREAALKKPQKPEIRISVVTRLNTTEWEFGRKFLQTVCDADARLVPEYVGNSEPSKVLVGNIDDCKENWAPDAIIDGPLGPSHVKWNFLWKRVKAIKYWGYVHHTLTTRSGELKLGWITLTATPDKRVDWNDLFRRLCILTKSKFATMHLRIDAEARRKAFGEEAVENFGLNDLLYGRPDVALKERGLASERRVALRNLFRPGLFRINEEPKPLPE